MWLLFIFTLLFISCEQQDLCDLNYYPNYPYANPDDTIYGETYVRYLSVCFNESGYNQIYTYTMTKEYWSVNAEDDYNLNYP